MNILLSMPNDNQSNNYIINALQDLNDNIIYLDHRFRLDEAIKYVPEILSSGKIQMMLVLYLVNGKTYPSEFIEELKTKYPNVKYCSWVFDITMNNEYAYENKDFLNLVKNYDYFFTVDKEHIDNFKKNKVNAFWAREGMCPYSHFPISSLSEEGKEIEDIDVCFMGQVSENSPHKGRTELIKEIVYNFPNTKIFGYPWQVGQELIPYHMGRYTFNDIEHNKVVNRAKINLGHSGWPEISEYVSARNYRICGAGGFLLTNETKDCDKIYTSEEVATYKNTEDCLSKIDYYLKHGKERKIMAEKAREKTILYYSFTKSLEKIKNIVGVK